VKIYAKRDGDGISSSLTHGSRLSTINFQPSTNQKLREYKAVYVQSDAEIGLFSDEVVVNCARDDSVFLDSYPYRPKTFGPYE